jgi:hypothetical protein
MGEWTAVFIDISNRDANTPIKDIHILFALPL